MSETIGLKQIIVGNLRQRGILLAFAAIVVLFSILKPVFLSSQNLSNLVLQYSYILILAVGMLFVIVLAQIDLSVGSVVAVTGAIAAVLVVRHGMPWWVAVIAALVFGILIGAWQGFWVAYVGIPGFIVTLAGMLLFRGLTYLITNNVSVSPMPAPYRAIANDFLDYKVGGYDVFTLVVFALGVAGFIVSQIRSRKAAQAYRQPVMPLWAFIIKQVLVTVFVLGFGSRLAANRGLPYVLILLAVVILGYGILSQNTVFGRNVYAIGGNIAAARLSGINVRRVTFLCFVNMGLLSGLAGVVFSARMGAAQPGAGNMFELDAIAACFIGGASTTGGIGKVSGAIIGALIMAVMSNGMQLMGADTATQQIVKGMVLLLAVAFDVYNKRRAGGQ